MNTQIPAARIPLVDARTGLISREWYQYLFKSYVFSSIGQEFLSHTLQVAQDYSPDLNIWHLLCSGNTTIFLQSYSQRDRILTITNVGTGVITIKAAADELIKDQSQIELDFQWTTVQLCPIFGGYIII